MIWSTAWAGSLRACAPLPDAAKTKARPASARRWMPRCNCSVRAWKALAGHCIGNSMMCRWQIDQTRLEQILVNLIGNALDAMQAQPLPSCGWRATFRRQISPARARQRPRHRRRSAQASVRTVLHHQARRTRPGPGPDAFRQPRRRHRWTSGCRTPGQRRHDFRPQFTVGKPYSAPSQYEPRTEQCD
jgi:hypothetical protein